MKSKAFPLVDWNLVIIGILYNLLGFSAGWQVLLDVADAGLIGVWDAPPIRGRVFWFLVTGFVLITIGLLVAQPERSGVAIPRSFIALFGLLTLIGVVLIPTSGLWLSLFLVAVCLICRLRRWPLGTSTVPVYRSTARLGKPGNIFGCPSRRIPAKEAR